MYSEFWIRGRIDQDYINSGHLRQKSGAQNLQRKITIRRIFLSILTTCQVGDD